MLGGCVQEARIAMPGDVAARSEQIELRGMGGWPRGSFRLGQSEGRFERSASEQRFFDTFVRNSGGGRFLVSGPDVQGELEGYCGFNQEEIDAGVAVFPSERLGYGCDFVRDGRPLEGGLFLAEVPTSRSLLAGRTRAGELRLEDVKLDIRAIHEMDGGKLPSGSPLGYAFLSEGRQIGAVDLNGGNKTIYAPRFGPEREAVLAASLALSIFWDPAD